MDAREYAARALIDECNATGARDRWSDAVVGLLALLREERTILAEAQVRADLRQRGARCKTCEHYARTHVGGPRGAGWCSAKQLPIHANTCACERWEGR